LRRWESETPDRRSVWGPHWFILRNNLTIRFLYRIASYFTKDNVVLMQVIAPEDYMKMIDRYQKDRFRGESDQRANNMEVTLVV
jgi:hypothetical protein